MQDMFGHGTLREGIHREFTQRHEEGNWPMVIDREAVHQDIRGCRLAAARVADKDGPTNLGTQVAQAERPLRLLPG